MAITNWNIDDGTKRTMWQNPTSLYFYTYPVAPSWKIVKGGQINQTLYTNTSTAVLPQFLFQGLRKYDSPVAWKPNYVYREVPYDYVIPINFVANTVNPIGRISQSVYQIVNNYAFKLQRIQIYYQVGPNNTAGTPTLGMKIYDWQARQLMSDFISTQFVNFSPFDSVGQDLIFGPHTSFPAVPLSYPVNGQIRIDLATMNSQFSGSVSDIQGQILLQGVNLMPCGASAPGALAPTDWTEDSTLLPYFYAPPMYGISQNQLTINGSGKFTISCDGDSEFWMTAVHNTRTAAVAPPQT